MEIKLQVDPRIMSLTVFKEQLQAEADSSESEFTIEMRKTGDVLRSIDPTIIVAVVGAAGTALGALIYGLAKIAQQAGAKTILIQTRHGDRLEFPANFTPNQIDVLIEKLKKLEIERISIPLI